jgi:hypothetical protein
MKNNVGDDQGLPTQIRQQIFVPMTFDYDLPLLGGTSVSAPLVHMTILTLSIAGYN